MLLHQTDVNIPQLLTGAASSMSFHHLGGESISSKQDASPQLLYTNPTNASHERLLLEKCKITQSIAPAGVMGEKPQVLPYTIPQEDFNQPFYWAVSIHRV